MTSFFSVDVETDGLGPGVHNLLSIGIVRYELMHYNATPDLLKKCAEFSVNLGRDPKRRVLPLTMSFWDDWMEAYAETRKAPLAEPDTAAVMLSTWLDAQCSTVRERIFVADPASFDFGMISNLCHEHLSKDVFHYKSIDLSSLASGLNVSRDDRALATAHMNEMKHTALGDARTQGVEFEFLFKRGIEVHGREWANQWNP